MLGSVSYTHLDVYKRQGLDGGVLGRQPEGVEPEGGQDGLAEHGLVANDQVTEGVVADMALVGRPREMCIRDRLWEERYPGEPSVHLRSWPVADPDLVQEDTVTMIVEVNGKVRARLEVPPTISEAEAEALALAAGNVQKALDGRTPQRVVVKPPRLVNIIL